MADYDNAIAACDRALYIEDDFAKAYIQKSNALIAKSEHKAAVECLELCQTFKGRFIFQLNTNNLGSSLSLLQLVPNQHTSPKISTVPFLQRVLL